ncbi:MAG: hypothetical protein PHC95_04940 [Parabacteroides sp.]|nr:hypothetical protein [Parabacteroides sp.]
MSTTEKESIVLGSGKLYYMEFTGEIPTNATIEVEANRLGYISGGATLEYKPTYYKCKDDLGLVSKTKITEEEATLKAGILTFNGKKLTVLCNTGRVTEADGIRTVKIGGTDNDDGKKYVLHFVHDDPDGKIRVTIVGVNEAGFSLAFQKDKETVIDAEFACQAMDSEGTLIIYQEEITTSEA